MTTASEQKSPEIGKTIVAGGIKTNYLEAGSGEPVIFIHGSGPGVLTRTGVLRSRRSHLSSVRSRMIRLGSDTAICQPTMITLSSDGRLICFLLWMR